MHGTWSMPTELPGGRMSAVGRYPSIATAGPTEYVVGNDIASYDTTTVRKGALSIWQLSKSGNRLVEPPAAPSFWFFAPKAFGDASGLMHLLWGEPPIGTTSISGFQWRSQKPSSIWTATYNPDRGWTSPRVVYNGPTGWDALALVSQGQIGPGGWAISAPLRLAPGPSGAAVALQYHGDAWRATSIQVPGSPAYTSLASRDHNVFLAFVSPAHGAGTDVNSVWLRRSRDRGQTWRNPVLVSRSGMMAAYGVQLLVAPNGALHMLWRQVLQGRGPTIRHTTSDNDGETWSEPHDYFADGELASFKATIDRCNAVHVVYQQVDEARGAGRLRHVVWRGTWSEASRPFEAYESLSIDLVATPGGDLLLTFLGRGVGGPPTARPRSYISRFYVR